MNVFYTYDGHELYVTTYTFSISSNVMTKEHGNFWLNKHTLELFEKYVTESSVSVLTFGGDAINSELSSVLQRVMTNPHFTTIKFKAMRHWVWSLFPMPECSLSVTLFGGCLPIDETAQKKFVEWVRSGRALFMSINNDDHRLNALARELEAFAWYARATIALLGAEKNAVARFFRKDGDHAVWSRVASFL